MTTYPCLYEFNERGLLAFEKVFTGQIEPEAIDPLDHSFVRSVPGTQALTVRDYETTKEMAQAILFALGSQTLGSQLGNRGLWAWLTFVLIDSLFPEDSSGMRKFRELHTWNPSDPRDYQKGQRHRVRMPVLLLSSFGDTADHLLCGPPSVGSEIREQLTSQQDMFTPEFQKLARRLYFDDQSRRLRRGAGGSGGGSPRRLAKVRKQLDVTWNLYDLDAEEQLALLPKEFDRFRPAHRAV